MWCKKQLFNKNIWSQANVKTAILEMHSILADQAHQNDEAVCYKPSEPQPCGQAGGGKYICKK